jgi:cytochrome c oxidase subunit II
VMPILVLLVVFGAAVRTRSLWIPQLNGKLDALPDHMNTLVIEADGPGTYQGRCAEFCGLHHAEMPFIVVAHPRALRS